MPRPQWDVSCTFLHTAQVELGPGGRPWTASVLSLRNDRQDSPRTQGMLPDHGSRSPIPVAARYPPRTRKLAPGSTGSSRLSCDAGCLGPGHARLALDGPNPAWVKVEKPSSRFADTCVFELTGLHVGGRLCSAAFDTTRESVRAPS
jgi:hypothetical protein